MNTRQFLNTGIYSTRTYEIRHGRGNRTLKLQSLSCRVRNLTKITPNLKFFLLLPLVTSSLLATMLHGRFNWNSQTGFGKSIWNSAASKNHILLKVDYMPLQSPLSYVYRSLNLMRNFSTFSLACWFYFTFGPKSFVR